MLKRFSAMPISIAGLMIVLLASACTTSTVTPALSIAPDQKYDMAAVGTVTADDKLWDGFVPYFRRGFRDQLRKDPSFASVSEDNPPAPAPSNMLVLSGRIVEIDEGSVAARWIIGMGAGRKIARGVFELRNANGALLLKFEGRKAYSGGAGIGGADLLSTEDLVKKLGAETAVVVSHWTRGEKLDPDTSNK